MVRVLRTGRTWRYHQVHPAATAGLEHHPGLAAKQAKEELKVRSQHHLVVTSVYYHNETI